MVAAYNAEAYVGRCLLSLLGQTVRDIEVVLVDDGSSDGTLAVARRLAGHDSRLRVVPARHRGVSAARNLGMQEAEGELLAFADADDYVHPQYIETLLAALAGHPEAGMAMAPSLRTTAERDVSVTMRVPPADHQTVEGPTLLRSLFTGSGRLSCEQCHVCHGKLFRRQLLAGLSFPERYSVCEDAVFMCQVYQRLTTAVWVSARLYFWYQHRGSVLHGGLTAGRIDSLHAYAECLRLLSGAGDRARAACLYRIAVHGQWLRYLAEGTGRQPEVERAVRAVQGPLRRQLLACRGLTLSQRVTLMTLPLSSRLRRRFFSRQQDAADRTCCQDVGKAPAEENGVVSVVVPVCNMSPWLRECLDSVVSQKYRQLEIILVDDGSTDGSGDICEEYAARDRRIRVIHQANGGLSAARNAGLESATGDYVLMPDGDDVLHPQLVSLARKALQLGDFPFAMVWASGMRTAADFPRTPLPAAPLRLLTQRDLVGGLTNRTTMGVNCHVAWNKLYRRQAIAGRRFEDTAAEDTLFHARMAMDTDYAVVVDAPLYGWRQREGSLSRSHSRTPKQADRLLSLLQCTEAMPAGSRYEAWFLEYLYQEMPCVRSLYKGTALNGHARWVVLRVRVATLRRLLRCRMIPLRQRLKAVFSHL